MTVTFAMRVTPAAGVLSQQIDEELILLHTQKEQYYTLNPAGGRMWRALAESPSLENAYESLLAEYEVAPDVLRIDFQEFVEELAKHGLVEVHSS